MHKTSHVEKKPFQTFYLNKESIKLIFMNLKVKKTSHFYNNDFIFYSLVVRIKIRSILVQTPLGTWMGFDIQPHYECPGELQIKQVSISSD